MTKRGGGRNRYMRRKGGEPGMPAAGGPQGQMAGMQDMLARAQQQLAATTVEGTAGGGMVRITMNGSRDVIGIKLEPEAVDPDDTEMLEELIMAAIGDATEKSRAEQEKSLGAITGNLGLDLGGLGLD